MIKYLLIGLLLTGCAEPEFLVICDKYKTVRTSRFSVAQKRTIKGTRKKCVKSHKVKNPKYVPKVKKKGKTVGVGAEDYIFYKAWN